MKLGWGKVWWDTAFPVGSFLHRFAWWLQSNR
jgi:hypothetical protein